MHVQYGLQLRYCTITVPTTVPVSVPYRYYWYRTGIGTASLTTVDVLRWGAFCGLGLLRIGDPERGPIAHERSGKGAYCESTIQNGGLLRI